MIFNIYRPPRRGDAWTDVCAGAITDAVSWEYTEFACGVGSFELVASPSDENAEKLTVGRFIICKDGGFIIRNVTATAEEIRASGCDFNGLLEKRLTVAQTENGYDPQLGYAETIAKHYVSANCTDCDNPARNFPGLVIAADKERGWSRAYPRFEKVSDVITDILSEQRMGWKISPIIDGGTELMLFDVFQLSGNGSDNKAVISCGLGTANSIKIEQSTADARNVMYFETESGMVQTQKSEMWSSTYQPSEHNKEYYFENLGYSRDEVFEALSCPNSDGYTYAQRELKQRFRPTDAITIEHIGEEHAGADLVPGDKVLIFGEHIPRWRKDTVYGSYSDSRVREMWVTSVHIKRTGGKCEKSVTVGDIRTKVIDHARGEAAQALKAQKIVAPQILNLAVETGETEVPNITAGLLDLGERLPELQEQVEEAKKTDMYLYPWARGFLQFSTTGGVAFVRTTQTLKEEHIGWG